MKKLTSISSNMPCVAHLLHLVVIESFKAVREDKNIFSACRLLATRTHKSVASQQRIINVCQNVQPKKINFNKIITPRKTRWKSGLMCMKSILHLKQGFDIISARNSKTDDILRAIILIQEQFEVIEKIVPILKAISDFSECISAKKQHLVIPGLYDIKEKIKNFILANDKSTADFVSKILANLNKRFPDCGSNITNNSLSHFLDPKFKGHLLSRFGKECQTIKQLKLSATGDNLSLNSKQTLAPSPDQELTSAEKLLFEMMNHDSPRSGFWNTSISNPFDAELNAYKRLGFSQKSHDILEWWRVHSPQLPLLSNEAKKVLCISTLSTSFERVFSQAGNIISCKRTLLKSETVEKLVYIKENTSRVTIKKWNIEEDISESEIDFKVWNLDLEID
ncbi:E3 SUMO-protein ligase ZBED1-like [Hydra vulgaris]|uniref:E3 SUMO-protein ligase ZBED1-like n=1 Tax=Hydra vulgaris TaxID=6087 RepID=A0ABM4CRF9_HYDVU